MSFDPFSKTGLTVEKRPCPVASAPTPKKQSFSTSQPRSCIRSISHKFETPEKRPYNGRNGYVHEHVTFVTAVTAVYTDM
jgi:hypothetical protein